MLEKEESANKKDKSAAEKVVQLAKTCGQKTKTLKTSAEKLAQAK